MTRFIRCVFSFTGALALAGGAVAGEDPYIESDGRGGINTGYRLTAKSRLEVDFAVVTLEENARIYGDDAYADDLRTVLYVAGGCTHFGMTTKGNTKYKTGTDTKRHTAIHDLLNNKVQLLTGTTKELDTEASGTLTGTERATRPLTLFGRYDNAFLTKFGCRAKARIYGVKIYENNVLARNYIPCLRDGEFPGFKDTCTGCFIGGEDVTLLTAGGDVPSLPDNGYVSLADNIYGKDANHSQLYFDTGYTVTAKTAVELDCALAKNYSSTDTSTGYLLTAGSGGEFNLYFDNKGLGYRTGSWHSMASFFPMPTDDKDIRRVYKIDGLGDKAIATVMTAGATNYTETVSADTSKYSSGSLKLIAHQTGTTGFAPVKIYGCKIYESGALVRDYVPYVKDNVPGLLDRKTQTFLVNKDNRDKGEKAKFGGEIAGENDAYIQSAGSAKMDTLYKMKGNSRVEVDFALWDKPGAQWRVFGLENGSELSTFLYLDGDTWWTMKASDKNSKAWNLYYATPADKERHTAVIDLGNKWMGFTTGSTTNAQTTTANDYAGAEASLWFPLFGRSDGYYSKARIYSVRFYEKEADGMKLVHEYLPYDGATEDGFYDTVTGDVISNGSTFTYNGTGHDHGDLSASVRATGALVEKGGEPVTLTAYAPGATSYRWLRDGVPVEGGTDGVFSAEWTHSNKTNVYQAVAVYADFYGTSHEGEPSVGTVVVSDSIGMVIIIQ